MASEESLTETVALLGALSSLGSSLVMTEVPVVSPLYPMLLSDSILFSEKAFTNIISLAEALIRAWFIRITCVLPMIMAPTIIVRSNSTIVKPEVFLFKLVMLGLII